jgi:hypothetical protein
LEAVLLPHQKKSFAEILTAMPPVGIESDFERVDDSKKYDVFD